MAGKTEACSFLILLCLIGGFHAEFVPFQEKFYTQTVDHFNFYTSQYGQDTYKQRYLVQDKWWEAGKGPIFFYTGNEGNVESFWNNTGFMFDIAPKFKALILFAEHRFYGKSMPFGDNSFKHPYVDLLTVEQALADFATLLDSLKTQLNAEDCPIITFGGSYGGMLSAYLRIKYPNVVDGAIAASAPVLMVANETSRDFFFEDVTSDFKNAEDGCDTTVKQAFNKMKQMVASGKPGYDQISKSFKLCKPINDTSSYNHLVGWIRNSFTILAMMDYPYPTNFMSPLPAYPVKVACQKLLQAGDPVSGLAQAAGFFYGTPSCYDIYQEFVECADPTGCGTGSDGLAWDYQACTELRMPSGTNNQTDMFPVLPFTIQQRQEYCQKTWNVTPRDNWMKVNMWGKDLKHTSNIVFSNGNIDPWHRGGVAESISDSIVALMVDGGAHHLDLRGSNTDDPKSVIDVRKKEEKYIEKWIKEARESKALYNIDNAIKQMSYL